MLVIRIAYVRLLPASTGSGESSSVRTRFASRLIVVEAEVRFGVLGSVSVAVTWKVSVTIALWASAADAVTATVTVALLPAVSEPTGQLTTPLVLAQPALPAAS